MSRFVETIQQPVGLGLAIGMVGLIACADSAPVLQTEAMPICAAPSASELQQTQQLLEGSKPENLPKPSGERSLSAAHDYKVKVGELFGVTVPDDRAARAVGAMDTRKDSFGQFFSNTRAYLKEFGINVTTAQPGDAANLTADKIPTPSDLETPQSKYEVRELTQGLSSLPVEYVALTGVKHMILAKNTGDTAYAITSGAHDTIVVDIGVQLGDPSLATHELTHQLDSAECGGPYATNNDPAYAALAGGFNIYNGNGEPTSVTWKTVNQDRGKAINDQSTTSHEELCKDQQVVNQELPQVVAYSDYGLTNVVEDKAEVGKNMNFPNHYGDLLDPNTPVLRRKFEFLMARLYHLNPGVVKYLAALSAYTGHTLRNEIGEDC